MCPSKATDRYLCPVTNKTGVKKKKRKTIQAGALAVLLLKIATYKMYRKLGSSGQQKSSVNELI